MKKTLPKTLPVDIQTLEITNFGGRLTRLRNGQLNSGFSKFTTSFGYDPFSKPNQLTWLETPVDLDPTGAIITDQIVCAKNRLETGQVFTYALGDTGRLYKIQPNQNTIARANYDNITLLATLSIAGNNSFLYGGSMEFFGATEKIYIGNDNRVCTINFDGTGEASIAGTYTANVFRALKIFQGNLCFGNGANIGTIDSTATVTSSAKLSPGLPADTYVRDLDVSTDFNYLTITASSIPSTRLDVLQDSSASATSDAFILKWNGSDTGVTAGNQIPSFAVTSLQTFLNNQVFFSDDTFGSSLNDLTKRVLTLNNNHSPNPTATLANGNFVTWINPEFVDATLKGSMYYYGGLDNEVGSGLWRMFRLTSTQTNGLIYQTPFNLIVNNSYATMLNTNPYTAGTIGYGKHYFSTTDVIVGTTKFKLYRFLVTPSGTGTPQLGVYETQNQLFGKRISIGAIRVYTEPTVAGNGFQLDVIGSDGTVVTNSSSTYTFSAGTDITLLQGSLERINFNNDMRSLYSFGLRITNTGTTNMTINKIEIDWGYSGK